MIGTPSETRSLPFGDRNLFVLCRDASGAPASGPPGSSRPRRSLVGPELPGPVGGGTAPDDRVDSFSIRSPFSAGIQTQMT